MRIQLFILILLLYSLHAFSQAENPVVRKGNNYFEDGKYKDAEISYRKAIEKNPKSAKGTYNLGNSLYKQDDYANATENYINSLNKISPADKMQQAAAYHNIGNTYLKTEKYNEAIDAYKQSLRLNPADNDTRYNLSYALNKLQQQQKQQNQQGENKKDNKDNKDKQQQQSQSNNNNDSQQDDKKDQQQKPQISRKDAERMLQALNNDEQKTLEKVNKQKVKAVSVQVEKDW